jgi:DNA-directed RNA polymerase specialized sigma24 family protein
MHDHNDDDPPISESYVARQRERDERYQREYAEWISSLPPEERRKVKGMGLDKAYLPSGSGGATKDAAESSRACCEDSHEEPEEPASNAPAHQECSLIEPCSNHPQTADTEGLHDLLRRLVGEMVSQSNARLSLDCLALVTGLAYDGDSMTEIAKRHDVTRAAVSKRCVELTQSLNLKPSRAMRSLLARESYRKARINHLRVNP